MRGSRHPPAPTKRTSVEITLVFVLPGILSLTLEGGFEQLRRCRRRRRKNSPDGPSGSPGLLLYHNFVDVDIFVMPRKHHMQTFWLRTCASIKRAASPWGLCTCRISVCAAVTLPLQLWIRSQRRRSYPPEFRQRHGRSRRRGAAEPDRAPWSRSPAGWAGG